MDGVTGVRHAITAFLRAEGADRLGHKGGRTLLDHLRSTAVIVRRWDQPAWLEHAALIHSVYGTDAFHQQLVDPSRRAEVAAVAGQRAEQLAYLFCATPRRPLFAGTYRWARDLPMRLPPGANETDAVPPARRGDLDALVVLHMANLADQACRPDGTPGRWLVRLRDLGELLLDSDEVVPPACVARLTDFTDADESLAGRLYVRALRAAGEARTNALALAATSCPVVAEPCVWLAHLARCRGDAASTRGWAGQGRARLLSLGTTWDKRLTFEEWLAVMDGLERQIMSEPAAEAGPISDPRALLEDVAGRALTVVPRHVRGHAVAAVDEAAGRRRFQRYVEELGDDGAAGAGRIYPDLPSHPWYEAADFPLVRYLEDHFSAIRAELLALDGVRFQRESERIGRTGEWDVAFLYERGRRRDEVCAACPVTTRAVETHRTMRTAAGLIYVSRMRPGTHISPHRGPTNIRLRCHLAISVPEGDCAIRVGDRTQLWREGGCLVFDDSFDHEAWNHTEEDRIVLIVDLWHPALSDAEVALLEGLHAHTYRHARRLSRYWAANAAAAREADPPG
ncbi:MAG: aspartyl/asparaginyl beta-hydroxylase domain-containing protein [Solirubrobacteraceae bacterium]